MRLDEALKLARARLGGKLSSALEARLLLQEATGLSHAELVADPQRPLSAAELATLEGFLTRRLAHEPVSRILGRREFYGRTFTITPDVLDPRPDTETVVELALKLAPQGRFVDLGTGSGAIAVTLCAEQGALSGVAVDVSPAALSVAEANARALGVSTRLRFHQGNWFEGLEERFDLIISNPPYITEGAELMPDVARFDPGLALYGGADGLACYRAIAAAAPRHLAPGGLVVVEAGAGQHDDIIGIFETSGLVIREQAEDLQGHIRALAFVSINQK